MSEPQKGGVASSCFPTPMLNLLYFLLVLIECVQVTFKQLCKDTPGRHAALAWLWLDPLKPHKKKRKRINRKRLFQLRMPNCLSVVGLRWDYALCPHSMTEDANTLKECAKRETTLETHTNSERGGGGGGEEERLTAERN